MSRMTNTEARAIAAENLRIFETGAYVTASGHQVEIGEAIDRAVRGTLTYAPEALSVLVDQYQRRVDAPVRIEVTGEDTVSCAARLAANEKLDVALLNFASAKNPGGGFLNGAIAQEEDVARASALYPCIVSQTRYYEANRACGSFLYTDHLIYSPAVPFFRASTGALLEAPFTATVLTSPAPNAGELARHGTTSERAGLRETILRRAKTILAAARDHGHRTLILGAWGCGVFRNDSAVVAACFEEAVDHFRGAFDRVTFAVLDRSKDRATARAFERLRATG